MTNCSQAVCWRSARLDKPIRLLIYIIEFAIMRWDHAYLYDKTQIVYIFFISTQASLDVYEV